MANEDVLGSWKDGKRKETILDFVRSVTEEGGPHFVPPSERIATFDNDGTLWCEKPMPIQLDFILRRLYAMAEAQPELRDRQPWKAAHERDYAWLGDVIDKHYAGDESGVQVLGAGVLAAYDGMSVEDFEARSESSCATPSTPRWVAATCSVRTRRWSNSSGTCKGTGSPTTSPQAVDATSCGRSARRCTASPGSA